MICIKPNVHLLPPFEIIEILSVKLKICNHLNKLIVALKNKSTLLKFINARKLCEILIIY